MNIIHPVGLLNPAKFIQSPNFNQRPPGIEIDMIVIHNISLPPNEFGGPYIEAFFTNQLNSDVHPFFRQIADLKVSCHCFIRRDGTIIQFVPFQERAWHAGISSYLGRENCNDYSIGIELEGADDIPYPEVQYQSLSELIIALISTYKKISLDRIVGHDMIAPDRKTDPGPAFDWAYLRRLIEQKQGRNTK